ncbi:hypothetical protein BRC92_11465 [Halobacteriales archaeon QS_4_69_31]|nr:MAG: hypothetical protein BRC92_11465 [Halobacteriales archaeon QS_4_69_31]
MEVADRDRLARSPARETALACLTAGVEAAHPERVLRDAVARSGDQLPSPTPSTTSPTTTRCSSWAGRSAHPLAPRTAALRGRRGADRGRSGSSRRDRHTADTSPSLR